jgi:hypothetical protein
MDRDVYSTYRAMLRGSKLIEVGGHRLLYHGTYDMLLTYNDVFTYTILYRYGIYKPYGPL